jgi:N,N'-diacetyllegionaminate synthase
MSYHVYIIAEAGVNHNGRISLAYKLVDVAVEAGADAVKFQTFKAEKVISKFAEKADYQKETTEKNESMLEMAEKLELSRIDHEKLNVYCQKKGIEFLSTPFDLESIDLLMELGLKTIKIASGEITNLPYLRKIGGLGKKVIMSSGMANLLDVEKAFDTLIEFGTSKEEITILHCTTEYPAPFEDVNLKAMQTMHNEFSVNVGYSDHTLGVEIPIAAVALGAKVIEKHITLDKKMVGPDHRASLEPQELKAMVTAIRNIEKAMGDGFKQPSPSEIKNISVARKSIVAKMSIKKGELLTEENLTVKRPGTGISPMEWDTVISKVASRDYNQDDLIE